MGLKQKLYLHTHNITGKKYLGQTTRDLSVYKGSSVNWLDHLEQYGDDYTTEILFESNNTEKFKQACKHYSEKFNIVDNPEYFNLVMEYGGSLGGEANPNYKKGKWVNRHFDKELERRIQKECDAIRYEREKENGLASFRNAAKHAKIKRNKSYAHENFIKWQEKIRGTDSNGQALQKDDIFDFWYNCEGTMTWDKREAFYGKEKVKRMKQKHGI